MKKSIANNHKNDTIIKEAVDKLLDMFRTGKLPEKVAFSIIHRHPGDVVCDTVKVPTVIVQNSPSHRGNFPIKSGTP